jgi:hypothetical protein
LYASLKDAGSKIDDINAENLDFYDDMIQTYAKDEK